MTGLDPADDDPRQERSAFGSLGSIVFLLFSAWGAFLALLPLSDNSFFTHLATGRLILDEGSVPTADPYSFTAAGSPWTVQSWLASVAYAAAERVGGALGVRLLLVAVFLVATALLWALTSRARAIVPRLLIMSLGMVVVSGAWSERPYMVGAIGMSLVWLALAGRVSPWWLLPFGIVWVNSHGSFPLAWLLCLAVMIGQLIDVRAFSLEPIRSELRSFAYLTVGLFLGAIAPLGMRALTFPVAALSRSETFQLIQEWQPPGFTSVSDRAFVLLLGLGIFAVVRSGSWRHALPVVAFGIAAVMAQRNVVMALPVLLAVVSGAAPAIGTLRSTTRPRLGAAAAVPVAALLALTVIVGLSNEPVDLRGFPARAVAYMEATVGHDQRNVAHQDVTGNFLEVLDGRDAQVFLDDRVDMYPEQVVDDFLRLHGAEPAWGDVLDEYSVDVVVWKRDEPFAEVLAAHPTWRMEYSDATWAMFRRRS